MKSDKNKSGCSQVLKALSDSTRLTVLELLLEKDTYVSELIKYLKIEPTLLSHHLSILRSEGLIKATRKGKTVLYRLESTVKISGKNPGLKLKGCKIIFTEPFKRPVKTAKTAKKTKK